MKKPTIRVKTAIFFLLFGASLISVLFPSFIWFHSTNNFYKREMANLRQKSIEEQRTLIKKTVDDALHYIEFSRKKGRYESLEQLQNDILDYLAEIRFRNGGYVFVNRYDGRALIFDGRRATAPKNIKDIRDINDKRLFDIQFELAKKPTGGYMHYHFKKMNDDTPVPKISYINSVTDWQWIIGAGAYLDTATQQLESVQKDMINDLKDKIVRIALQLLAFTLILALLSSRISLRLDKQFTIFRNFFKSFTSIKQKLDTDQLHILEFKEIGAHANEMVQRHHKMQNKIFAVQENLKNKTNLLNNVLQSAPEIAIITTDLDFEITYLNSFTEKLFHIKNQDIIDKSLPELHHDKAIIDFSFDKIVEHLTANNSYHKVIEHGDKNNTKFIHITASGIYSGENDLTGYLFFCSDVTKRKLAEEELERHRLHLEKLVEERTAELEQLNNELLEKNKDLEHFNDLFVGREFRIKELRDRVKELEAKLAKRS